MIDPNLLALLPEIRRCRDYRLYDGKGRRYLDMYQLGGHALGGHRPEGLSHSFKNHLSRGIWGELPNPYARELRELLAPYFPDHPQILLFPSEGEAHRFLYRQYGGAGESAGAPETRPGGLEGLMQDPALGSLAPGRPALWRPLCPAEYREVPALVPVLPFPGAFAPRVVCLAPGEVLPSAEEQLGSEMACSSLMLAALVKAVTVLPKLADNENRKGREDFDRSGAGLWYRRGPYLAYRGDRERYPELFRAALEGGILLHPGPGGPSILPLFYTQGEMAPLLRLMENYGN
jgi:hypothetical protein